MNRLLRSTVFVAIIVFVCAMTAWKIACNEPYQISVTISRSSTPGFPYVAKGSVAGCGPHAVLVGHSEFQLLLKRGSTSRTRTEHGGMTVQVVAGVTKDEKTKGWYTATIERNSKVVASKHEVVTITE